jgi:hypothetical protein
MARRGLEQREQYWRGVLERQRKSGQSIRAFCLANKIPQASFFNWRRKLTERQIDTAKTVNAESQRRDPLPFIPVKIQTLAGPGGVIELLHPRGCLLRVPGAFDPESLLRILRVLDQEDA